MLTDTQNRVQLWDLIKDIKYAMFTTHHANGHLHSRPMTTQNRAIDEDNVLWFFMPRDSDTVADIEREAEVNLAYADPDNHAYISISGHAGVVEDDARKRYLWSSANEAWFPNGQDDPQVALVKVTISHADFWDAHQNTLTRLFGMAKAALTGHAARDMATHGHVRMN